MSERGGCERKSPTSRQAFYRKLAKVGNRHRTALAALDCGYYDEERSIYEHLYYVLYTGSRLLGGATACP
jgi:hypothetical protein